MNTITRIAAAGVLGTSASAALAGDRVLIVATSHGEMGDTGDKTGLWLAELTHPYFALSDAGFSVDIASIEGGAVPIDPRSLDEEDAENTRFLGDPELKAKIEQSMRLDDVKADNYRAVVFSGGHGTMWDFPDSPAVQDVSATIYESGGVIAAVCHGPAALVNVRLSDGSYLLDGKKVTGFSNVEERQIELDEVMPFLLEDKMVERGASFSHADPWHEKVVADGRVVTGQNPQSAKTLGEAVAELLEEGASD